MSKYLEFLEAGGIILIRSKKDKKALGEISYYAPWKQYIFEPSANTLFNDECLMDIIDRLRFYTKGSR